jgi:hypothetical protein
MPRSGSAWLANFLTSDGLVCHHDPLGRMSFPEVNNLDAAVDTGAYLFKDYLRANKYFALVRDVVECNESLKRLGLPEIAEDQRLEIPTFHYEKMFDVGYLAEVWSQVRGIGFDSERAKFLIDLNVQHRLDRVIGAGICLGSEQR